MGNSIHSLKYTELDFNEKRIVFYNDMLLKDNLIDKEAMKNISSNDNILQPIIEIDNNSFSIQFTIDQSVSLREYCDIYNISMTDFYKILYSISVQLKNAEKNSLIRTNFIFKSLDLVFLKHSLEHLNFIYIPITTIQRECSIQEELHFFAKDLYRYVSDKNSLAYNALVKILTNNPFTIESLLDFLLICLGNPDRFSEKEQQPFHEYAQKKAVEIDQDYAQPQLKPLKGKKKGSLKNTLLILGCLLLSISIASNFLDLPINTIYVSIPSSILAGILIVTAFNIKPNKPVIIDLEPSLVIEETVVQKTNSAIKSEQSSTNTKPQFIYKPVSSDATQLLGSFSKNDFSKKAFLLDELGETYPLTEDETVIGRNKEFADIIIDKIGVSRIHCKIKRINNEYFIEDLNSKNKTYLNGKQLQPHTLEKLEDNSSIKIATFIINFKIGEHK